MPSRLLLLPLALVVPVAAVALLARAAHAAADRGDDSSATWFSFWRRSQLAMTGTWALWLSALWVTHLDGRLGSALAPYGLPALIGAMTLLYTVPPALANVAITALAQPVWRRLCGVAWTRGEAVRLALWQYAALVLPLLLVALAAASAFTAQYRLAAAFAVLALVTTVAIGRRRAGTAHLTPHAITSGELRDRLFALARACKVPVRQLYVVPATRMRLANAFAVRGQVVVLTDYLLEHLSRREVDAVLAHELTHLAKRHPGRLLLLPALAMVVAYGACASAAGWLLWPATIATGSMALFALSRRFERVADRGAVALTKDPEALISALAKIARLNHLPLDWGAWTGRTLTHPSTRSRALAIARATGLHRARVEALLRDGLDDAERYPVPAAVTGEGKAFSSTLKARAALRNAWTLWATFVAVPALVFALAEWIPGPPHALWLVVALAATIALSLAAFDDLALRPYAALRPRLAERLRARGLDPDADGAAFVGLSPGEALRIYEGLGDWDAGFLRLEGDHVAYAGEETRFALRRDQVANVRLVDGLPGWLRAPRVVLEWRDDRGAGAVNLRPADVERVTEAGAAARALFERLTAWWVEGGALARRADARRSGPPWSADLEPPRIGEVTGLSPRALGRPRRLIPQAAALLLLAALASALLALPFPPAERPGFTDVFAVALLTTIFHRIPVWRWREAKGTPARPAERAAA